MSKRYVLLVADGEISEDDLKELTTIIEQRHRNAKLIPVKGNRRAVVVRTDNDAAPLLRNGPELAVGGKKLAAVITSGSIGKLKSKASEATNIGQVLE
jgi:hypothetical protein